MSNVRIQLISCVTNKLKYYKDQKFGLLIEEFPMTWHTDTLGARAFRLWRRNIRDRRRQIFSKHKAVVATTRNIIFCGDYILVFDELLGARFFQWPVKQHNKWHKYFLKYYPLLSEDFRKQDFRSNKNYLNQVDISIFREALLIVRRCKSEECLVLTWNKRKIVN